MRKFLAQFIQNTDQFIKERRKISSELCFVNTRIVLIGVISNQAKCTHL